jgi:hypothetical protein
MRMRKRQNAKLLPLSSRNGMSNMRVWPFAVEVLPDVPLVDPPPEEEVVPVFAEDIVYSRRLGR